MLEAPSSVDKKSFELYCLGEFDHSSGLIRGFDLPSFICNIDDVESLYNKMKTEV